jgi:hypothetical protein
VNCLLFTKLIFSEPIPWSETIELSSQVAHWRGGRFRRN